ncbi:hypothetical protein NC653_041049 [Populus alba x Populus x berolinensis]|uniref:Uncharacterized protein n=1 Tax=Populus alba x Populus x berolinensis TaxID=444605 RepID=A0AAD6PNQ8_9ROSI|nr:hypothetical protein NC653_041049 [Populus alba x Populus x berolinensis]
MRGLELARSRPLIPEKYHIVGCSSQMSLPELQTDKVGYTTVLLVFAVLAKEQKVRALSNLKMMHSLLEAPLAALTHLLLMLLKALSRAQRQGDILLAETHQQLASSPPPAVPIRAAPSPGPPG